MISACDLDNVDTWLCFSVTWFIIIIYWLATCTCTSLFFLSKAVRIVIDYKLSLRNLEKDSEEYVRVKSEV